MASIILKFIPSNVTFNPVTVALSPSTVNFKPAYITFRPAAVKGDNDLHSRVSHTHSRASNTHSRVAAPHFRDDGQSGGVVAFARRLIEDMRRIGKRSAVKRFSATVNSLLRYTGGKDVAWRALSSTFILGFEEFMRRRGLCRNSTSFYMRNLRAIVNRAVEEDIVVPRNPFRHVYMGVDKTAKRAVTLDVIRRIRDVDLQRYPALDFARNVFMFAFYTRGMSFVDIAFLKKSNVRGGAITYFRRKTRQQIIVRIEPEIRRTIAAIGASGTSFLLPIIRDEDADVEQQYINAYYRVNRNLQKVGKMLGLDTKLTLYVARHAWASIALSNKVPLSTISKAMGHDSEKTTLIYLRSLDTASVDKANSDIIKLMDRRKNKR